MALCYFTDGNTGLYTVRACSTLEQARSSSVIRSIPLQLPFNGFVEQGRKQQTQVCPAMLIGARHANKSARESYIAIAKQLASHNLLWIIWQGASPVKYTRRFTWYELSRINSFRIADFEQYGTVYFDGVLVTRGKAKKAMRKVGQFQAITLHERQVNLLPSKARTAISLRKAINAIS